MSTPSGGAGTPSPAPPGLVVGFTSGTSGVGRTSAVSNVAWILAAAGKRVLIADWSTESSTAHEFLEPFHVGETPVGDDILQAATALRAAGWGDDTDSRFGRRAITHARRYVLPAGAGRIDLVAHAPSGETWRRPAAFPDDKPLVAALRAALRANYDHVLIDGTTGPEEPGLRGLAWISDVVVFCFKVRQRAIADAARAARLISDEAGRGMRFVFSPSQVDDRDPDRVRRSRRLLREGFAEFLDSARLVEIPYYPDDAYDERLAALLDDPRDDRALLHAYESLAAAVTADEVRELTPIPPAVRARYRRAYGLGDDAPAETMYIVYAPEDRPWADWIRAQLAMSGVNLVRLPPAGVPVGRTVLAVVSGAAPPPAIRDRLQGLRARSGDGDAPADGPPAGASDGVDLVGIRVAADVPAGHPLADGSGVPMLSLVGRDEYHARRTLLSHFALIAAPAEPDSARPRYPVRAGDAEAISNLAPRSASFVGRDDEIEAIRDALTRGPVSEPYVIHGPPGVGKSELAREYAHRFAFDYDVIWWIPAQSRRGVHAALAALSGRLAVPEADDVAAAVLAVLAGDGTAGTRRRRWLLIYDNADDHDVLNGLLPEPGAGHVLITSRAEPGGAPARPPAMGLDAFDAEESVALLRRHTPQISDGDARRVSEAVGHLPFSLRLAGAWLRETATWLRAHGTTMSESLAWSTAEFVARLSRYRADHPESAASDPVPAERPGGYPVSAAGCLAITLASLRDDPLGRLTIRLVEMCAFLSSQGVARWLLCARPTVEQLVRAAGPDGELIHKDGLVLHQVFWMAARFGLLDVDWGRQASVRMHRLLQDLVRDHLSPDARAERQGEVLSALAANVPTDADNAVQEHRDVFAELHKHLAPSGGLDHDDPHVRHWVLNQVRYLYILGDDLAWREALEMSGRVRDRWTRRFGPDDELRMQLVAQVANLHRALGDAEEALRLDEELLSRQRRALGTAHPRTLRTGRGRGADLRAMGRFSEALAEDQATWLGFREAFGDDHPETLMAANSLARSTFLTGDHRAALAYQRDVYERQVRLFGPDDPDSLWYATNLGSYLREVGDYHGSRQLLTDTLQRIRNRHPGRQRDWLRVTKSLAVTERRLRRPESAQEHSTRAERGYRQALGDDHVDTLACGLSLAADLDALGDAARAVRQAERCLAGLVRSLGDDHPFTHLGRVNLGGFLVGAARARGGTAATGDAFPGRATGGAGRADRAGPDRIGAAREMTGAGLAGLREELGEQHPWTLAAAINHACALAAAGEAEEALRLDEATAANCEEFLGADHRYTRVVTDNLREARRAAGEGAASEPFSRRRIDIDVPST